MARAQAQLITNLLENEEEDEEEEEESIEDESPEEKLQRKNIKQDSNLSVVRRLMSRLRSAAVHVECNNLNISSTG